MTDDLKDDGLSEAYSALLKAWQALQRIEASGLSAETYILANRVLRARQAISRPVPAEAR
jgi:hypothetical protein